MADHGTFYWNELMTRDVEAAKRFYGATLGWGFSEMPMPDGVYHLALLGDKMVGGIFDIGAPAFDGVPESWFAYIAVDDLDARLAKLREAGGTVDREPWDVPGVGRIAIVSDVNGATMGWIVPAAPSA
ncbi:VOC family protein [Prosthecomicrobium pneumaticum]|uniref:VOC domain-containing protein n=1 Tax=Prosthecomicrobium pneumaticum TaxID=81895 RepID=A0A7W9L312_9HYPH|nr:VOC family protein [Prosthecomicrobium pneumaticum]MBB5754072.1 hypothetical protein [Prosthecomicrobium pneumaticum]